MPASVMAQDEEGGPATVYESQALKAYNVGYAVYQFSHNGQYMFYTSYSNAIIYDLANHQLYSFTPCTINSVTDDGMAVGSVGNEYQNDSAAVWTAETGWIALPPSADNDTLYAQSTYGVSADGNTIIGSLRTSTDNDSYYLPLPGRIPVVWTRQADGSWSKFVTLPYILEDYTKRTPQAQDILAVSADGSVITGRNIAWDGGVYRPLVYTKDADGKWKVDSPAEDFSFNLDQPQPVFPDVKQPTMPDGTKWLSEEELAAYNAAMTAYQDSVRAGNWPNYYPQPSDFFDLTTADGVNRYNEYAAAVNTYNDSAKVYNDSIDAFYAAVSAYVRSDQAFDIGSISNAVPSANGKYSAFQAIRYTDDGDGSFDPWGPVSGYNQPVIFNNADYSYTFPKVEDTESTYGIASVLDNGGAVCCDPMSVQAYYIKPEGGGELFGEYLKSISQQAYDSLMQVLGQEGDSMASCVYWANGDGTCFFGGALDTSTWNYTDWWLDASQFEDFKDPTAISELKAEDKLSMRVDRDMLYINGKQVNGVEIFSLGGSKVLASPARGNQVSLGGLSDGIYVVKVNSAQGRLVKKIHLKK